MSIYESAATLIRYIKSCKTEQHYRICKRIHFQFMNMYRVHPDYIPINQEIGREIRLVINSELFKPLRKLSEAL